MRGLMCSVVTVACLIGAPTRDVTAQDTVTAVDVTGLADGVYVLSVSGGQVSLRQLRLLAITPGPRPIPTPTPVPTPAPALSERAKQIQAAAKLVQGDADRATTAQGLAVMYGELAAAIRSGKLGTDPTTMAAAVKTTTDLLLAQRGPNAALAWAPVRDLLSTQWAAVAQQGGQPASYAALLTDAADGLNASVPKEHQFALDPAIIELIMQIIQIVLKLLIK